MAFSDDPFLMCVPTVSKPPDFKMVLSPLFSDAYHHVFEVYGSDRYVDVCYGVHPFLTLSCKVI